MDGDFQKRHTRHKKRWYVGGFLVLALFLAIGIGTYFYMDAKTPIDNYAKRFDFPLYYPSEMPRDYNLITNSVKSSEAVLFYNLKSPSKNNTLVLGLQALPSNFDAIDFMRKDSAPMPIPVGTLYNVNLGGKNQFMITTKQGALITINATSEVDNELINTLATSLKKVK